MKIEEVKSTTKTQRIAAHSHVKGLGLDENGEALAMGSGLVGQETAREAAGVVVELIKSKKMAGRAILLAGPPGTGKVFLCLCRLCAVFLKYKDATWMCLNIFGFILSNWTVQTVNYHYCCLLQVTELTPCETENPMGGYGKTVSHVVIGLKTAKGTKQLKLDPSIYESLQKEKVEVGDVIYIEANSGAVKVLFIFNKLRKEINKVHMLDIECFTYLHRALESTISPIVIFATNRGNCTIRGTELNAPHGIPLDLLDRLMIIRTLPYSQEEMVQIIRIRAQTENIQTDDESLNLLGEIGTKTTLRYAVQLLTPANLLARINGRDNINRQDVEEIDELFYDVKSSVKLLAEQEDKYMK
ncbi:PREDICTED: ruvB-like 1 [Acropora digitifera]|uniref:ruvB-like 1 n=1 Tax=Acropora digitifera TaxID=70779 RepID=UPI00077A270D|nr:PREDICTED: ruvB-like 1 [Acropora digitifera]